MLVLSWAEATREAVLLVPIVGQHPGSPHTGLCRLPSHPGHLRRKRG